jgi:hypothetical protein
VIKTPVTCLRNRTTTSFVITSDGAAKKTVARIEALTDECDGYDFGGG